MFKLVLTNNVNDLHLYFKIRDTEIAKKWYDELSKSYPLFETDRFTNWGMKDLFRRLNNCIDIINKYDLIIDEKISSRKNLQAELNRLHKIFEDYRGEVNKGTVWFNTAPKHIQCALEDFNILIHKIEADNRTSINPTAVVTFKDRPMLELTQDDIKHFTFKWKKNTVYIDYCHVGKTVLDVFKDCDDVAKGVRPQTHYSADFMVKFGPSVPFPYYYYRKYRLQRWIKLQNFDFKNYNLGMIPVADLIGNVNKKDLLNYTKVKEVECIK